MYVPNNAHAVWSPEIKKRRPLFVYAVLVGSLAAGIGILIQSGWIQSGRIPQSLAFMPSGRGTFISTSLSSVPATGSAHYHWVGWHRNSWGTYIGLGTWFESEK